MRVVDMFRFQAREDPEREFAVHGGRRLTYGQADDAVLRTVTALRESGIEPNDRIGVLTANCVEFVTVYLACSLVGCVPVPLNYRLAARELSYILQDSGAVLLISSLEFVPLVESALTETAVQKLVVLADDASAGWASYPQWVDVEPAAPDSLASLPGSIPAVQSYTSGTTGRPKGVLMSNDAMGWYAESQGAPLHAAGVLGGRLLVAAPVFHAGITALWMTSLAWGGSLYIQDRFVADDVVFALREERVAWTLLIPSMIQMCLVNVPDVADRSYPELKLMVYGGSSIAEPTLRRAIEVFDCDFLQQYGLTETNAIVNLTPGDHRRALAENPDRLLAAGRPLPACGVRVVDEDGADVEPGIVGEILLRGPHLLDGYWHNPIATAETLRDGWLWTGDAGCLDSDGYLYVRDRIKDVIITGGENVYSREVESVLFEHPDLVDAAVIGVPDEMWGEAVKAIIVAAPGVTVDPADIISFCRERVANYKCPKTVDIVTELPRNPSGKVLKRMLRDRYTSVGSRW
jgi:acyl-CoA synthetase (AMP-forming)/AMP-acid ligase II